MAFHPIRRAGLLPVECWEYGLRDVARGLRAALGQGRHTQALHLDGIGPCIPVRSGRSAIVMALEALDLPKGARIAAPLYCCPVVFKAIRAAGMQVRFIDVEPDGFCMSADDLQAKRHECDAVIAVHTFGHICDMQAIVSTGLPVVEDCAQAIGSSANGTPAGRFGDVAVFSFRSGKYLSVGEGGALHARHPALHARLEALVAGLPAPGAFDEALHVAKTLLRSALRSRPLWGLVGEWIWSAYGRSTEFSAQTPIAMSRIFRSDLRLARERLGRLPDAVARQRAHAQSHAQHLVGELCTHPTEPRGQWCNRYLYPLLFQTRAQRDRVAQFLHDRGIGTIMPYKDNASLAAQHFGYAGNCPQAESVAQRVLVPPSSHALGHRDLQRVARSFREACAQALTPSPTSVPPAIPAKELG
jgi:perosamine synthetase